MSPEQWIKKLSQWLTKHKEAQAKALLSEPKQTTMGRILKPVGVILVMGDRRGGKSVLAFKVAEHFHDKRNLPAAACYPTASRKLRRLLPKWIRIVTSVKDFPHNCICIIDEAALVAHARRGQSTGALDMEDLVALSEQKGQLIILISHHARKLDINDVHGANIVIWKQPTLADTIWERSELQMFVLRAWEFFQKLYPVGWNPTKPIPKRVLQANFAMNLRRMEFYSFKNGLPSFWSQQLSTAFKVMADEAKKKTKGASREQRANPGTGGDHQRRGRPADRQPESEGDPDRRQSARYQALRGRSQHPPVGRRGEGTPAHGRPERKAPKRPQRGDPAARRH